MFDLHSSKLSKIFFEIVWVLLDNRALLFSTFGKEIIEKRAIMYANAVHEIGGSRDKCIGFIDGTKIKMSRRSVVWNIKELFPAGINSFIASHIK